MIRRATSVVAVTAASVTMLAVACGDDELFAPRHDEGDAGAARGGTAPLPARRDAGVDAGPTRAAFGLDMRPTMTSCRAPAPPAAQVEVVFHPIFAGVDFGRYVSMMRQAPGDTTRWFASGLYSGKLFVVPTVGAPPVAPAVADVAALAGVPLNVSGEGGFLGFAFHPKFAQNGRVYVSWTGAEGSTGMTSRVGYITSHDGGASFTEYANLFTFEQPFTNHNGGGIEFGPDGYLYLSFGDGGSGGDPLEHGQNRDLFFSKILRIDVDDVPAGGAYGIPSDNPFAKGGGEPATFAYGFRNPFRFGFDRATGDLWVGDVGEATYEEIDSVDLGGNYGWSCKEGFHLYATPRCPPGAASTLEPVFEYVHAAGALNAIVGGTIYHGKGVPSLLGQYVFGDYETGAIYALRLDPSDATPSAIPLNGGGPPMKVVHFTEDNDGELYVLTLVDGGLHRIDPAPADAGSPSPTFPDRLSSSGCDPRTAQGLLPFDVNAPAWTDGATANRFVAIPPNATITRTSDDRLELPNGSVVVETLSAASKPVETRMLVHQDDGAWAGYSYEWLDDGSDALLLPAAKRKIVQGRPWRFPARSDCVKCHNDAAGRTLALEIGQLNRDFLYSDTNRIANQLATLEHIGLLAEPLGGSPTDLPAYPEPLGSGPLAARARAYVHVNCSSCHRPGGATPSPMDLRFATPFAQMSLCNADAVTGEQGGATKLFVPGAPSSSQLSLRMTTTAAGRMPAVGTHLVDSAGTSVVDSWIAATSACP